MKKTFQNIPATIHSKRVPRKKISNYKRRKSQKKEMSSKRCFDSYNFSELYFVVHKN